MVLEEINSLELIGNPGKRKMVTFNDEVHYIYTPTHLIEDLQTARKSDFLQRRADALRMQNLLTPVFNPSHRKKMYEIIYGTSAFSGSCQLRLRDLSQSQ
jgi:hypothetical protein